MRDIIENKEIKVNKKNIIPLAEVKEESDVTLNLELYKNNMPFDVTGQSIKLGLLINNELIGEQSDGITINKNVVTIKLKNSFIQPGKLELDLTLTDNTGRMTTSSFYLIVNKKTIGGTSIQGTDLLETLDQIILDFEVNFRETIDGFVAESTELLSDIKKNGEKTINVIKSNYDSLKQIIIDENQAANLQEQINSNKNKIEQLEDLTPVWEEHSGIGNITINDSFDGVTKDLVIKGKTLKNLSKTKNLTIETSGTVSVGLSSNLIAGKEYTVFAKTNVTGSADLRLYCLYLENEGEGDYKTFTDRNYALIKLVPSKETRQVRFFFNQSNFASGSRATIDDIFILEGDYTKKPPSAYFDSITSAGELEDNKILIKSVGKNLCDNSKFNVGKYQNHSIQNDNFVITNNSEYAITDFIPIKTNTKYVKTNLLGGAYYDLNKKPINTVAIGSDAVTFTTPNISTLGFIILNVRKEQIDDEALFQLEENTIATNYEQYREYIKEINIPFEGGLKSLPSGISDEIYDNGKIIQKIEKRVYKTGDELLPNVITDKKNTIVELSEYKTYDINPFFLRTFNKITHLYQENNICGEVSFEIAKDRDAIINNNTNSILNLNETTNKIEKNNQKQEEEILNCVKKDGSVPFEAGVGKGIKISEIADIVVEGDDLIITTNKQGAKKSLRLTSNGNLSTIEGGELGTSTNPWGELWLKSYLKEYNGYTKLPNGLILQWGSGYIKQSNSGNFAFPIAFPNDCVSITASGGYNNDRDYFLRVGRINKSTYSIHSSSVTENSMSWIAIGY